MQVPVALSGAALTGRTHDDTIVEGFSESSFHLVKDDSYGVRAVERAVDILGVLAASPVPLALTAIAGRASLSVPTTFRLLRTLQGQRLVGMDEHGRYTLGARVLELGHAYVRQLDIVAIARPFLVAARDRVNETAVLAVRSGDVWVSVVSVEANQPIRRVMAPGETTPLYGSGTGKLLLAAESDDEVEAYIGRTQLAPFSATTVVDATLLRAQIGEIRASGYACSVNERGAGGVGVSAPIRAHDGRTVAAVLIAAPASRFTPDVRAACVETAVDAAAGVSAALGYVTGPGGSTPFAVALTSQRSSASRHEA